MTSTVARMISKKILGETLANNFGKDDPYFETVPATRLDGRPSKKTKKRRKALPLGISEHDGKVLTKVKRRAYRLDMSLFDLCGIRFGWSSVIGIIPGIGDVIDAFMAIMVLRTCQQVEGGLPSDVRSKMYFNIVLDFGIGLVPFLGDVADALFRANTRNAVVLENYLRDKGAANLKAQGRARPAIDPSDADEFDRHIRELGPPPQYASGPPTRQGTQTGSNGKVTKSNGLGLASQGRDNGQMRPAPQDRVPEETRGGWFSGFRGRNKVEDVERGNDRSHDEEGAPDLPNRPQQGRSTLQKSRA